MMTMSKKLTTVPPHLMDRTRQLTEAGVPWELVHFVSDEVQYVRIEHDVSEARVKGVGACSALTAAPVPLAIRKEGGVEVYELPDTIYSYTERWNVRGFYGPVAEVCAVAGVPIERAGAPARGSRSRCGGEQCARWRACFPSSGNLYLETWREGESGAKKREETECDLISRAQAGEHLPIQREEWREYEWRAGIRWYGHQADLIEADVCPERHLSSASPRASGREENTEEERRRPGIDEWKARRLCEGFYEYWVRYTGDEAKRQARLQENKAPLFSGVERFTEICEGVLRTDVRCTIKCMNGDLENESRGKVSYRYSAEDVAKVEAALEHAMQLLQSCSPIAVRTAPAQKSPVAAAVAKARHDGAFLAFLAKALPNQRPESRGH